MDSIEVSKEWCASKKYGIGKATEEDKASHSLELEEGEFRRYEPFGSESLVYNKGRDAGITKLSSSAQVTVKRQSMSRERHTHRGDTANTVVEKSDYTTYVDQSINLRQPTFQRKYYEKHYQSYSRSSHTSSKERHMKRKRNRFRDYEYHHDLEKIEKVSSKRLSKLVSQQIEDRKKFNILQKKQKLNFFQEHVRSYKFHYVHVIPTVKYDRIKLPKLVFGTLSEIFCRHMQAQLRKFVKQQINDRNKEKRMKERWIFEAKAGYLQKYFDETSLTHSEFEMEKSKFHVNDYPDGKEHLKYLDMQSLSSAIEVISDRNEVAGFNTSKNIVVSDPIIENSESALKTNGGSADAADKITTIDSNSMPSQSSAMEFVQKVRTQITYSQPPQSKGETMGRSCSSVEDMDGTSEISQATSADSSSREKQTCTSAAADASESSCSRPERNLPHEFLNSFHETTLNHEEPARPLVHVNQRDQPRDQTSSLVHVTDQLNTDANLSTLINSSTQLRNCDRTGQNATYPYLSDRNTCSVGTELESRGASNIQQQATNQMMTGSTFEHYMLEVRLESDPSTIELNQVLMPCHDRTSSFPQTTERPSRRQHVTQHPLCGDTCQTVAQQHQPSGASTPMLRTWLDNPGESNVQQQSAAQPTTDSTSEHMLEIGLPTDLFKMDLSRLRTLRDMMTQRHLAEIQKLNLQHEMEMAEIIKKYDDQLHNLEMEKLQEENEIQILYEKVSKQQLLAEAFRAAFSCSRTGPPLTTTISVRDPSPGQQMVRSPTSAANTSAANQSSGQHRVLSPTSATPTSAIMN